MRMRIIQLLAIVAVLFASATLRFPASTLHCKVTYGGSNSAEFDTVSGTSLCTSGTRPGAKGRPSQFVSHFVAQYDSRRAPSGGLTVRKNPGFKVSKHQAMQ